MKNMKPTNLLVFGLLLSVVFPANALLFILGATAIGTYAATKAIQNQRKKKGKAKRSAAAPFQISLSKGMKECIDLLESDARLREAFEGCINSGNKNNCLLTFPKLAPCLNRTAKELENDPSLVSNVRQTLKLLNTTTDVMILP